MVDLTTQPPTRYFAYTGSGGIKVAGPLGARLDIEYKEEPTPVFVGGEAEATWWDYAPPAGTITVDLMSTWDIKESGSGGGGGGGGGGEDPGDTTVVVNQEFGVNAAPTYYWYRVESECGPLTCPPFSMAGGVAPNDCDNMTMIVNVLAANPADVCNQLSRRGLNKKIKRLLRQTLPAYRGARLALGAQGVDTSCNPMVEVPVEQVPECLQMTITVKPVVTVGVSSKATILAGVGMLATGEMRAFYGEPADPTWKYTTRYRIRKPTGSAEVVSSSYTYVGS